MSRRSGMLAPPDGKRPVTDTTATARQLLATLAGPAASLRPDQGRAIRALVDDRERVLVVQRTGWGKSAVYFIATRLLRDAGAGPTLLVSPLLALMRDQLAAASRMGLRAATVNSTNVEEWAAVEAAVTAGDVDLLLVSPERLNHPRFRREILDRIVARVGMLVIDEAHCISDHGHDFRPDYRRLRDVLDALVRARTTAVPVLACTATATDRVVDDVAEQLASRPDGTHGEVAVLRGSLARDTLHLQVLHLPSHEQRLAWLATYLASRAPVGRAGIVYTLTVAEAERTAAFLAGLGHDVAAYTSRLGGEERSDLEDRLQANRLAAVVATTALSMGYDKPDLGFVVHLGAPSSPVAYYQAIGRAGRGGDATDVVCLPTAADERLWHHFDVAGIPTATEADQIVAALRPDGPTSLPALEAAVNVRRTRLDLLVKVLDVEGVIERVEGGYRATGRTYGHDHERYQRLLAARRTEHEVMRGYLDPGGESCRMVTLTAALDDPDPRRCGHCDRCTGQPLALDVDPALLAAARAHVRDLDLPLPPRRRWPPGLDQFGHDRRGNLPKHHQAAVGRALAGAERSGYGAAVAALLDAAEAAGKAARDGAPGADRREALDRHPLLDDVVDGLVQLLARWDWPARPEAIVTVPSATYGEATRAVAQRLGALGRLPVHHDVFRAHPAPAQATRSNSAHQAANALDTLTVVGPVPTGPVLLVDASSRSGWTMTVAGVLLAEAGAGPVLPLVLHAAHAT
jgi:ATP-dependent DNA helicase RecQ